MKSKLKVIHVPCGKRMKRVKGGLLKFKCRKCKDFALLTADEEFYIMNFKDGTLYAPGRERR